MKSGVSLQQMLTEVKRQSESKEDYLIAPNRLRMESYGKEMFLHLSDDSGTELIEPMTITGIAHALAKRVTPQQMEIIRLRTKGYQTNEIAQMQDTSLYHVNTLLDNARFIVVELCRDA